MPLPDSITRKIRWQTRYKQASSHHSVHKKVTSSTASPSLFFCVFYFFFLLCFFASCTFLFCLLPPRLPLFFFFFSLCVPLVMSLLLFIRPENVRSSAATRQANLRKLVSLFPLGLVSSSSTAPARVKASAAKRKETLRQLDALFAYAAQSEEDIYLSESPTPPPPPSPVFSAGEVATEDTSYCQVTLSALELPSTDPSPCSSSSSLSTPFSASSSSSSASAILNTSPLPLSSNKGGQWKTDKDALAKAFVPNMQCLGIADTNRATIGARRREKGRDDGSMIYIQEWHHNPEKVRQKLREWQVLFEEEAWTEFVLPAVKKHSPSAMQQKGDAEYVSLIPERLTPTTLAIIEDAVFTRAKNGNGIRQEIRDKLKEHMKDTEPEKFPAYVAKVHTGRNTSVPAVSLPRNAPTKEKIKHCKKQIAALNERMRAKKAKTKSLLAHVASKVHAPSPAMTHKRTFASLQDEMHFNEERRAVEMMHEAVAQNKRAKRAMKESAEAAHHAQ